MGAGGRLVRGAPAPGITRVRSLVLLVGNVGDQLEAVPLPAADVVALAEVRAGYASLVTGGVAWGMDPLTTSLGPIICGSSSYPSRLIWMPILRLSSTKLVGALRRAAALYS
jgi:hypothetical protein